MILLDSRVTFADFWKFYRLKRYDVISGGNQFRKKSELFVPTLLYFTFKRFKDPNSSPFIRLQCILLDSGVVSSGFWNFYKLKWGDKISGRNEFWRNSELFGLLFCISNLKVLWTQSLCHSLDINALYMIQQYTSKTFEICTN